MANAQPIKKVAQWVPEVTLALLAGYLLLDKVNADLWNDEIYTLKHFVLTSLSQTVTDYHVPNNHVFANLVNNIFLKVAGIDSLGDLMASPWIPRSLFVCYALVTMVLTYRLARKIIGRSAGLIAVLVLLTTLPWHNFVLQIRGYGLSAMLFTVLLTLLMAERMPAKVKYPGIAIISALLFYTLPSNLYGLVGASLRIGTTCSNRPPAG